MKLLIGSIIMATSASLISAQQAPQPEVKIAKVIAEIAAVNSKTAVKNSPFSADEINESVQALADGNRIVRSSTGKIYRNSDGRLRREVPGGVGGMMGSTYSTGQGVSILNPALGHKYLLDSHLKTAQIVELGSGQGLSIAGARAATEDEKAKALGKLTTELKGQLRATTPVIVAGQGPGGVYTTTITGTGQGGFATHLIGGSQHNYETRSEDLGTRDFEGVSAEGTRKITTIPAGAIGNELPIEITYERWFSKELGFAVYSKNNDPRFGEQIYKLTNLVRTEPDPSLFSLPTGYKVLTEPSSDYRISTKRAAVDRAASRALIPVVYKAKTAETKPVSASSVKEVKP